jgi:addiction module RelE/StbE family toxin
MAVFWKPLAIEDRDRIFDYIAQDKPHAALKLDTECEERADSLIDNPELYKEGRVPGTREIVVRPNYIMVYRIIGNDVEILRVLHAAQQWPLNDP